MARTTLPTALRSASRRDDRGTGLIGTVFGVMVFLVLLLFAVQVLFNLYATSVVTAAAFDAAHQVADAGGDPAAQAPALDHAHRVLGRYYEKVRFDWAGSHDAQVNLHVHAENRNFAFAGLRLDALQVVDRTVKVRVECFREGDRCR